LIWSFSFGLIKTHLVGYDPLGVALVRLTLSALVFVPFLRAARIGRPLAMRAAALGAVQFGAMYWLYITSYRFLPAYGVALFTIFTPIWVVLVENALARRWSWRHALAALVAVAGAALIVARTFETSGALLGIGLVQLSNLCFAVGQVGFRRLVKPNGPPEASLVAWMYVGAAAFCALAALVWVDTGRIGFDGAAVWTLLYLGVLPTAVGFYLWNKGAARVTAGVLAAANNLKVPLGVLAAWFVFGESVDAPLRVVGGLVVIGLALGLAVERRS
jgi:drug/metabolite transporter (DMT)-like permease